MSKADNKELEEVIKTLKRLVEFYNSEEYDCYEALSYREIEAIETLLKELKRLQEENSKLEKENKTYINSIQSITPVLLKDYIEKDKIREKIEELEKQYKEALEENSTKAFILKCQIEILKKLLEEK